MQSPIDQDLSAASRHPLAAQARDGAPEGRRKLLHGLTDLFLDGVDDAAERSKPMLGDIVCHVLDEVVEEARIELAQRVAEIDRFPPDVIRKLASDIIEVALPVLERSKVLTDKDLIAIAEERSQEHLLAISRREELAESVTDILIHHGEEAVLHSLTANAGARISDHGFGELAHKADGDEALQEKLIARPDMPESAAGKLESLLEGELKQRLKTMRALSMKHEFDMYILRARNRLEKALRESHSERIEVRAMAADVEAGRLGISEAVGKLARENRPIHLGWLLAAVSGLPEAIVSGTLGKMSGFPIAVTCRALDVSNEAFLAVAMMRSKRLDLEPGSVDAAMEHYDSLNVADAQRTMRFLKVRVAVGGQAA